MQNRKALALQIAGAVVLATLYGTSAFAESRHPGGTSRGSGGHITRGGGSSSGGSFQPHERSVTRSPQRYESRGIDRRNETPQRYESRGNDSRGSISRDHVQRYESRGNVQSNESRGNIQRGEARGSVQRDARGSAQRDYRNGGARGSVALPRGVERDRFHYVPGWHGGVAPYRPHEFVRSYGRVDRCVRYHDGYRVWLGGGLYPIFVPFGVWARFPLRVGLFIRFGGYWDPFGYWAVNDYAPYYGGYSDPYYYDRAYSTSGLVHGVVESVDYRRGTLVLNDDISRQFVTVDMPRDRRMNDVRPGDYVEFSGDWNRGLFDAYRLERWDYGRGGSDRDYDDRDRY